MVRYTVWLDTQMVGYTVWLDTQSRRPRIARDPAIPEKRDSPRSDGRTDTYTAADPGYTPERYTDRYLSDVFLSCISHQVGGYTRGSDSVYLICAYISDMREYFRQRLSDMRVYIRYARIYQLAPF